MLSEIQLWGVDKLDGSGATMAGQIVCTDAGRWEVQREFNRRMKQRFQELGIRIAPTAPVIVLQPQVVCEGGGDAGKALPSEAMASARGALVKGGGATIERRGGRTVVSDGGGLQFTASMWTKPVAKRRQRLSLNWGRRWEADAYTRDLRTPKVTGLRSFEEIGIKK